MRAPAQPHLYPNRCLQSADYRLLVATGRKPFQCSVARGMDLEEVVSVARMCRSLLVIAGPRACWAAGEQYELGPTDVVIATPPKSGTTMVQQVLCFWMD